MVKKLKIEIPNELKKQMKDERLKQYISRMYQLLMDLEAYNAVGDTDRAVQTEKSLEQLEIAYSAVEAM